MTCQPRASPIDISPNRRRFMILGLGLFFLSALLFSSLVFYFMPKFDLCIKTEFEIMLEKIVVGFVVVVYFGFD